MTTTTSFQKIDVFAFQSTGRVDIAIGDYATGDTQPIKGSYQHITIEAENVEALIDALRYAHTEAVKNKDSRIALRTVEKGEIAGMEKAREQFAETFAPEIAAEIAAHELDEDSDRHTGLTAEMHDSNKRAWGQGE